jgi:cupin 2 domain-containing protein
MFAMSLINLFKPDQAEAQDERFDTLFEHNNVTIERILSPPETVTEMMAQPHDEWICILQGSARLEMGDQVHQLHRGDQMLIPAHTPHRVLTTSHRPHCLWLAVHIR